MSKRTSKIVVSDSTVMINLIHAGMLCLLGAIPGYFFVVPDEVVAEVTYPDQEQSLLDALKQGWLASESITDPNIFVVEGYPANVMPGTYGSQLTSKQIDDLVAYMLSLK